MGYKYETAPLESLNDLLDISKYNGSFGTIFVIDEIQNEFSCRTSKDFPETLLSLITQQRKNRILILTTSQVFTRVSKPLREQAYRVIECQTIFGRYTRNIWYDGISYSDCVDVPSDRRRRCIKKLFTDSFCQTDYIRNSYDSYKLIKRLDREGFVDKLPVTSVTNYSINRITK